MPIPVWGSVDFGSFTARMSKLLTNPKLSPWFLKH